MRMTNLEDVVIVALFAKHHVHVFPCILVFKLGFHTLGSQRGVIVLLIHLHQDKRLDLTTQFY